ncbi:hypothetical protein JCM8547_000261 [Rhodosporidiobolus lusitaniae]
MSRKPDKLPDWEASTPFQPPPDDQTSDGSSSTVTGAAAQPGAQPWPWPLSLESQASLLPPDTGQAGPASGGDRLPTSAGSQPLSHDFAQFDLADPSSYWSVDPSHSLNPPSQPPPFSHNSDASAGGNGVSLSMLDLASGAPGGPGDFPGGISDPFDRNGVTVGEATRRGSMDSGLSSSATRSRKHMRVDSGESEGEGTSAAEGGGRPRTGTSGRGRSGSGSAIANGETSGRAEAVRTNSGDSGGGNGDKKMVQRSDKSCKKCRERRVRCDRHWPTCDRCKKRRETCEWAEATRVEEIEEGGDQERIANLTAKVASLERQLKSHTSTATASTSTRKSPPSSVHPSAANTANPSSRPSPPGSHPPPSSSVFPPSFSAGSSSASSPSKDNSLASISSTVQQIWGHKLGLSSQQNDTLVAWLMNHSTANADLGRGSMTWRLGEDGMAMSLARHLLDAAYNACCSKLPGIAPLAGRIDHYKLNLDTLSPPEQCHVAVLCALGARASPHSQLIGMDTIELQSGGPSPPLYLYAGERREMACRHLEARARELCWQHGIIVEATLEHLDALVGLVQLLIYEEILPSQSRFFLRNAVGMYQDMRQEALERRERTSREPKAGPGAALFLADAMIAATCYRPCYITTSELDMFFVTDGVPIPDFPGSDLRDELSSILSRPLSREKVSDALSVSSLWVCGTARLFAQLTTARRPGAPSSLPLLKNLWVLIDKVHNAVQELQQLLVSLTASHVQGCEGEPYTLEHFVLLGVRFDAFLVDLINLMHGYLLRNRNGPGVWSEPEDDPLLSSMRAESELRVRKCLKLSSFYAQLYLQSQDKHLVHHMLMQLEMLPDWTRLAAQRTGSPGGPISQEYELTEDELDWFQQALELSSYYTPKAAHRLQKMAEARAAEGTKRYDTVPHIQDLLREAPKPTGPLPTVDHLDPQRAAYISHMPTNAHYHYDLPPHNLASVRHLNPPTDPSHLYKAQGGFIPDPSQLYVFDSFGVASAQGFPLDSAPAVQSLDFVQHSFQGQNWMDSTQFASQAQSQAQASGSRPSTSSAREPLGGTVEGVGSGRPATAGVPRSMDRPGSAAHGEEWMRAGGRGVGEQGR